MSKRTIISHKLRNNDIFLTQLLGLCPLLEVSSSSTIALCLGLVTTLVLMLTNFFISLLRNFIPKDIHIPIYIIIIASIVNLVQMATNAWAFSLYQLLEISIPLITTNCIIISRAIIFASKNTPIISLLDGLFIGISFTIIIFLLGSVREIFGQGTLFNDLNILFGDWAEILRIKIFQVRTPFLLIILPPGAFIISGIILALKYLIDKKYAKYRA